MEINVPPVFDYAKHLDAFFSTPEMVAEVKRIVDDQVASITHQDKLLLIGEGEEGLWKYHHGYGTFLRNKYNLWNAQDDAPKTVLTKRWCEDESSHDIRNDTDYSIDHPDAVSMHLIRVIYHKVIFDRANP